MNPTTEIVENICCKIDTNLLGINKYHCFRSFSSAILSYYNTLFLPPTTANQQIQKIASYIPSEIASDERKKIFVQLLKQHWYVHYLIQILIKQKIKEFECVNGSTIDLLLNPNFTDDINGIQEIIHTQAHESFFYNYTDINNPVDDISCVFDTQFICLWHNFNIEPFSLIMSKSTKSHPYLKALDLNKKTIIWNIKTGHTANKQNDTIKWKNGYTPQHEYTHNPEDILDFYVVDKNNDYAAFVTSENKKTYELPTDDALSSISSPLSNTILVFKRPTKEEYLGRLALNNSLRNQNLLVKLQKSTTLNQIDGFPQENLLAKIKQELREISKPQ